VHEEFVIDLERPRDLNSVEIARRAGEITKALRSHLVDATKGAT
jgi:hypothetical protein